MGVENEAGTTATVERGGRNSIAPFLGKTDKAKN